MSWIGPQTPEHRARYRWQLAGVLVASALACGAVLAAIQRISQTTALLRQMAGAAVYSCCIGLLSSVVLHRVGDLPLAQKRGWRLVLPVGALLVTNIVGCLIAGLVLIPLGLSSIRDYWPDFQRSAGIGVVFTLIFGLSMYFYQVQQHRLEMANAELRLRQIEEERAHKLAAQARLSSLESRIHPHFLFNTLNSIAALIPNDPQRAEDMVTKFAALLRFSLNSNQTSTVPLGQEAAIVRSYLEIERARFGDRLRYEIDVPPALEHLGVPPLALQTLVENSVKHVIARRPTGGLIRVSAQGVDGVVHLDVTDGGPGYSLEEIPAGHGVHNLIDRLTLVYGGDAYLDVIRDGAQAIVRVTVPRSA